MSGDVSATAPGWQGQGDRALLTGFGNHHASEAVEGALPVGRNSPQRVAYGLYAEQISGTKFSVSATSGNRIGRSS